MCRIAIKAGILFLAVLYIACVQRETSLSQLEFIALQEMHLNCALKNLRDSIDREWTFFIYKLSNNLPSNMTDDERRNMLQLKNGPLIRMFESFANLDTTIKRSLAEMEHKDLLMTASISRVRSELNSVEEARRKIMSRIASEEPKKIGDARRIYRDVLKKSCV
ncbi:MAG: hypothetical protein KDC53_15585 [Saprospiraceae bacterium]|nr:hypothetical protein [Saprospiraceae bacterium]